MMNVIYYLLYACYTWTKKYLPIVGGIYILLLWSYLLVYLSNIFMSLLAAMVALCFRYAVGFVILLSFMWSLKWAMKLLFIALVNSLHILTHFIYWLAVTNLHNLYSIWVSCCKFMKFSCLVAEVVFVIGEA